MDTTVVHDRLSWTACYDDNCFVHMSSEDGARWWPQRPKKGQNNYATTSGSKGLAILEKAVRDNLNEIEETDTCGTQDEDNLSDHAWMYLNLDADPDEVDQWEVDMGLKTQLEYPENAIVQQEKLHHERTKGCERQTETATIQEFGRTSEQLEELMATVQTAIQDQEVPERPKKGHGIEIRLPTGYATPKGGRWMHTGGYMPPEFLNKVKALENLLQRKYNQYEVYQHPEQIVQKGTDEYV